MKDNNMLFKKGDFIISKELIGDIFRLKLSKDCYFRISHDLYDEKHRYEFHFSCCKHNMYFFAKEFENQQDINQLFKYLDDFKSSYLSFIFNDI